MPSISDKWRVLTYFLDLGRYTITSFLTNHVRGEALWRQYGEEYNVWWNIVVLKSNNPLIIVTSCCELWIAWSLPVRGTDWCIYFGDRRRESRQSADTTSASILRPWRLEILNWNWLTSSGNWHQLKSLTFWCSSTNAGRTPVRNITFDCLVLSDRIWSCHFSGLCSTVAYTPFIILLGKQALVDKLQCAHW